MKVAYLGIGSNIGDREHNLITAIERIKSHFPILDFSSIYSTSPVGYTQQPAFLNMVVKIDTALSSPFKVLSTVKAIEKNMGRVQTFRWGPRLIDIDILHMEKSVITTDILTLPHKEMFKRNFVLVPLSEITDMISVNGEDIRIIDAIKKNSEQHVHIFRKIQDIEIE
jgi:2-amino-4-hydroxy-6-hydroxymethyldihydropteridine diphosphokinase